MSQPLTKGQIAINWIEKYCRIPEGKFVGRRFSLDCFQKDIIRMIYDNEAITRKAIISLPRKSAKTTLAGCLLLLHLIGPFHKRNTQLVSTALTRDQAALLFNLCAKMIFMNPDLSEHIEVKQSRKELVCPKLGTVYRALSSDAGSNLGTSPILAVHDEVGAIKGPYSALIEAVDTGAMAHEQPLAIYISTQAATDSDLYSIMIDDAKKGEDPRTVLKVYAAPDDVDPFSPEAIAYHPAYKTFVNVEELKHLQDEARRMPTKEASFRNYILNQRIETNTPFINKTIWQENGANPQDWKGKDLYIGLDLSRTNDLTSLTILYENTKEPWEDDTRTTYSVAAKFYLPKEGIKEKSLADRTPWDVWGKEGHLTLTEGRVVSYGQIARELRYISDNANIVKVAFDRYNINYFKKDLLEAGFSEDWITEHFVDFGQGFLSMGPAIRTLENMLLSAELAHGNNPVLSYCMVNTKVIEDAAKNRKFVKQAPNRKIDGAVTLAMAAGILADYGKKKEKTSYLAKSDLFVLRF